MRRRRAVILVLVSLGLVAGSALLVGFTAGAFGPEDAQSLPDLAIRVYIHDSETDPFAPGNLITYQIYYINQGSYVANEVRITSTLPEHTSYVFSDQPGFVLIQAGPDQAVWLRDRLTVFERGWLAVTVRVDDDAPPGAGIEISTLITSMTPEDNWDNNESILKSYIRPAQPDLRVTTHLWRDSDPVAAGNEIVYEIVPQNWGGSAAHSVRLTATLPAGCAYLGDDTSGSGFTTVQTGTQVVWTQSEMAPEPGHLRRDEQENLYVHCQVAGDWTPEQWLEHTVEISNVDAEYGYDNNLSRWVHKPEVDRQYGAAITSLDDRSFRQLSDAGFDYALYYLDWSQAEPKDNEYYWDDLDAAVWQAWRHNLRLVVRVDRAPGWERASGTDTAPPKSPAKLGDFLKVAATRWRRQPATSGQPQVYGWIIWNEPNLSAEWGGDAPDPGAYTNLLQEAYNGVKASSPEAWVISAGLAPTGDDPPAATSDLAFLDAMYAAGAASYFDYLGANPMGFASPPDEAPDPNGFYFGRAEKWRQIMEANGDGAKSMFGAETGWLRTSPHDLGSDYNWMKVSEVDQAHYLARAYHRARCEWVRADGSPWLPVLTTWNLDFAGGDYTETDHPYWFSVTGANGDPLRAYHTLQNAARRGPADLWLQKKALDPVRPGQEIRYAIRYTNIGGQTAGGVVMRDTLPPGTEYVGDSGGGVLQPGGDAVIWNLGEVSTCTYETITLTLRLVSDDPAHLPLRNRVEVNTMPGEPYTDDNVAVTSDDLADLVAIEKSVSPARVAPGQPLTYTLAFGNPGDYVAAGVVITDLLPAGPFASLSYTSSGAAITATGGLSYTWLVEDLSPGESGRITITAVVSPSLSGTFSLTNRTTISTTSGDLRPANNASQVSSTVDGDPPQPPALDSPPDGAAISDDTPTLHWNHSPSADVAGYLLDWNGTVQDVGRVTQHSPGLLADDVYTWTVAAYDAVGNSSAYAPAWSFTVDTTAPDPPILLSPANGETVADSTPTLTWLPIPGADVAGYLLKLDGTVQDVGSVIHYTTPPLPDGTHTWTLAAYDALNNTGAYTDTWSFTVRPYRVHLPLLMRRHVRAPDLVVERLVVSRDTVQVVIKNQGNAPAPGGFWVDVYVDPDPVPTAVNQTWEYLCDEGLVWAVTADLRPMEVLTLTVGDGYYSEPYSHVSWPLATGTPVYAQVDSTNLHTTYGGVLESHEILGEPYNNIAGPSYATAAARPAGAPARQGHRPPAGHSLPPRR